MRRVVISGYYGFGNGGDEAMLAALVDGLRRRQPNIHLTVLSAHPEATAKEYGVESVGRRWLPGLSRVLRRADLLISGGGNLLQDVSGPLNIPYYLGIVELARWHGVPTMLLGQGIGPVHGRLGRWLIGTLANKVQAIAVRESQSAELLRSLHVHQPEIVVTADAVFSLDLAEQVAWLPTADQTEGAGQAGLPFAPAQLAAHDQALVAVSLRQRGLPVSTRPDLAAALKKFTATTDTRLLLVPMQPQEDLPLARWVGQQLGEQRATVLPLQHWRQVAAVFQQCEAVIGMRLHALILAALAGKAPLGLSYDPKVDHFLAQLGMTPVAASDCLPPPTVLADKLVEAYQQRGSQVAHIEQVLPRLQAKADLNFAAAWAVLQGENLPSNASYKKVTAGDGLRRQGRKGY